MATSVLIIDDDESLAEMLAEDLRGQGLSVAARHRGKDGLRALEEERLDAVILDITLPDLDGFEVCRRIRERSSIPVLMLTARGEETDRIVGLEIGADDYLAKPFSPRELLARLRAVLRRTRASEQQSARFASGASKSIEMSGSRPSRATSALRSRTIRNIRDVCWRCAAPATYSRAVKTVTWTSDMHRLYLQIYVAVLGVLLILSFLIAAAFWVFDRNEGADRWLDELTTFAQAVIPPADAPTAETRRIIEAFADPLHLDLSLLGPEGELLLQHGRRLELPSRLEGSGWLRSPRGHRAMTLALIDGRRIVVDGERDPRPLTHLFSAIALLGLATAVAAFPLARRLTRRLETLKTHVEALGAGHLAERVAVEGRDEIAELARAVNATANRIEALVADKSRLLANTSHELRTPRARVRMALELLREDPRPELLARIDRDVEEFDQLIGELLVASRLDAPEQRLEREPVDLLALAAEEAARLEGVAVHGRKGIVAGDPRLLRRLVRNLMENALRHGQPPVEAEVSGTGMPDRVQLVIEDRGPGVPDRERKRIFEPFYRPAGQASAEGGTGLALVRQIALRHAGSIRCKAREGRGTRFVLELSAA